jgi:hypothetical protein
VAKLSQRLCLDLADSLSGDVEILPDFFERPIGALTNSESHAEDARLSRRQGREQLTSEFGEARLDDGICGADRIRILDEVRQATIVLFTNGCLEADRIACDSQNHSDFLERQLQILREFFRSRLSP